MKRMIMVLIPALVVCLIGPASAEWRVEFESKTVYEGSTDVTVGVTVCWEAALRTIVIPVIVRELDPGSFWAGDLPVDTLNGVRRGVTWNWSTAGWPDLLQLVEPRPGCATPTAEYDGISPDNFLIAGVGAIKSTPAEPTGREIVTLEFDVTTQLGRFEFDTACLPLGVNTIGLYDDTFPGVDHGPMGTGECVFNKGIITIAECDCSAQGDVTGGGISISDLVWLIDYALKAWDVEPPADASCPALNRADYNCDGKINLVDIVHLHHYLFLGDPHPCNVCAE